MKHFITILCAGAAALWLAAISPVLAQQMYKWTDENGVVHFSDTPPPGEEVGAQDLPPGQTPGAQSGSYAADSQADQQPSVAQQRREEIARKSEEAAREARQRESQCAAMQDRLAAIEPHRRVFYTNEAGETVRMDDEERVAEVARVKRFIEDNCN
jgi:hypothetical protein